MTHHTIVLGAGLSGLSAAGMLRRTGRDVLVLEKSRGLGGRAATRRWDGLPVDHGAQFFTARTEEFKAQVDEWTAAGICHEWTRGFHRYRGGNLSAPGGEDHPRYACRQGMSSLGRALAAAENISVEREAKVASLRCDRGTWVLGCEDGREFRAGSIVVTCPPPQGAALLGYTVPEAAGILRGIAMDPCLAVAARFPRREIAWHGIQSDDAAISWIGHDTSKRPRLHEGCTVVVVHAAPEFSRGHYDAPEADVVRKMLENASAIAGHDLSAPEKVFLQRWRYAQPAAPRDGEQAVSIAAPAPLVLAGESFAGGKIEGAWLSGRTAAMLAAAADEKS